LNVVCYIDNLLQKARELRASDIHLEPMQNGLRVRLRIDGFLVEHDSIPVEHAAAVTARVKLMSHLDISEKRIPQDGEDHARTTRSSRVDASYAVWGKNRPALVQNTR
jgi:type II secretory ATPase GspE/PulE/Tfp pilus assembly ATPase PilB-like protein